MAPGPEFPSLELHKISPYLPHFFCSEDREGGFYEGFVSLYQPAWCHVFEHYKLNHIYCHGNLKFNVMLVILVIENLNK
jgi:hypothetical protein